MKAYEKSQKKRFEISNDGVDKAKSESKQRLYKILETYRRMNVCVPELEIDFSLFGSLAKGRKIKPEEKENIDIDLCIFLNDEILQYDEKYEEIYNKLKKFVYGSNTEQDEINSLNEDVTTEKISLYDKNKNIESLLSEYLLKEIGEKYKLQTFFLKFSPKFMLNDPYYFYEIFARENIFLQGLFGLNVGGWFKKISKDIYRNSIKVGQECKKKYLERRCLQTENW